MLVDSKAERIGKSARGRAASALLLWVLLGAAFILNGYAMKWVYPDNPLAGDLSAATGALILAAPILGMALRDLARARAHINGLVAVAVLAALANGDWRAAGIVAFFMLTALVIETRTAEGAHASIESLVRLTPTRACKLLEDGAELDVPAAELTPGDRIRVRPGQIIPADGTIAAGQTTLNEATITGESLPLDKAEGQDVFAGTQNLTGMIEITVTHTGEDTTLGRVRELILAAEQTKLPIMRIVDRYVQYYTPLVLMLALLVWLFTRNMQPVISLLVISCPCALILATPSAMVAALSAAARLGILVKDIADLEGASRITAFVLDKTGTLTTGRLAVGKLAPREPHTSEDLLFAAASVEMFSNHPVARALQRLATEANLQTVKPTHFSEKAGQGVRGKLNGKLVLAGKAEWLQQNEFDSAQLDEPDAEVDSGSSIVFVVADGKYLGWIGLQDSIRAEARDAIAELREQGIQRIAMITGDREPVAQRVADQIGCTELQAGCLPEGKVRYVNTVKAAGYRVAVVGDGVNDAPALAAGDTGIAMGAAGSDVALHTASIALMNSDLRRLPFLVRLSRTTRTTIYQNLTIGLLFITGGLVLVGLGKLTPILAAVLHNVGSLAVVFNSARLFRAGGPGQEQPEQSAPGV